MSRTIQSTRSEAKEALQCMVVDAGAGPYGGGHVVSVGDLLDQFLAWATLGPTTRADWLSVTERHLKPALDDMQLWKHTSRDCDQLYARMKAAGLGRSVSDAPTWSCTTRWPKLFAGDGWPATRSPTPHVRQSREALSRRPRSMPSVPRSLPPARLTLRCGAGCKWQLRAGPGAAKCVLSDGATSTSTASCAFDRSVSATASAGVVIKSTKTGKPRVVSLTAQAIDALTESSRCCTGRCGHRTEPR